MDMGKDMGMHAYGRYTLARVYGYIGAWGWVHPGC